MQAFIHIDPHAKDQDGQVLASEEQLELASIGALLANEVVVGARAQLEHPMSILFLGGPPKPTREG